MRPRPLQSLGSLARCPPPRLKAAPAPAPADLAPAPAPAPVAADEVLSENELENEANEMRNTEGEGIND